MVSAPLFFLFFGIQRGLNNWLVIVTLTKMYRTGREDWSACGGPLP